MNRPFTLTSIFGYGGSLSFLGLGFIVVLVCTAFCINVVMRKQWIEIERLSYPIIELPQQMATKGFFRNRLMWAGSNPRWRYGYRQRAALLVSIHPRDLVAISSICDPYFTTKPWNAIGWTPRHALPLLPLGWHILCRSTSPSPSGFFLCLLEILK